MYKQNMKDEEIEEKADDILEKLYGLEYHQAAQIVDKVKLYVDNFKNHPVTKYIQQRFKYNVNGKWIALTHEEAIKLKLVDNSKYIPFGEL